MEARDAEMNIYCNEISHAIRNTSPAHLAAWAGTLPGLAGQAGWRRVTGLTSLARTICQFTRKELGNMADALDQQRLRQYWRDSGQRFYRASREGGASWKELLESIQSQPEVMLPKILFVGLGFYAGSGGFHGDGGIPDLDLLMGIDAHRSVLTHSIIAGIAFETLCFAALGLFTTIYYNLPDQHQAYWDELHKKIESNGLLFLAGGSAGIAYHLGVDAIAQPAPYHDFPVSMPMEGHQTVMAINALSEAGATCQLKDVGKTAEYFRSFSEAATTARKKAGSKVHRSPDGNGFWVTYGDHFTPGDFC